MSLIPRTETRAMRKPKAPEANRARIKDPDVIQPGWELDIPSRVDVEGEVK